MQLTDPLNSVFFSLLSSGVANQERWFWGEGGNKVTQTLFTMIENSLETVYCSFFLLSPVNYEITLATRGQN